MTVALGVRSARDPAPTSSEVAMTRASPPGAPGTWVLLSYRLPREPSTPRITIWRKLKRLGVAQIGDGVVALPADARTREHLEWIAEEITDAHGTAAIWLAQPTTPTAERELAGTMAAARTAEYTHVITEATAATRLEAPERAAVARRLRAELRRIHRRDYFSPTDRDTARRAVQNLIEPDPERLAPAEEHP
ncbi:MAG: Chromate resistance protein ChrB [Pseudonocardiaceae bacterium]